MIAGLHRALDAAEADDGVRVVVLAGAGRAFSSGFDLDMETGDTDRPDPLAVRARAATNDFRIIMRFWDSPKVTIAAVHRYCLGSAMELALACDHDDRGGRLRVRGARSALRQRDRRDAAALARGPKRAKELLLTGEDRLPGRAGALDGAREPGGAGGAARWRKRSQVGRRVAANDRFAVALTKQAINRSLDVAGMRQALLQALEMDVIDRNDGNRGIARVQRDPETEGAKAAIAWRAARAAGAAGEKASMNKMASADPRRN